MSLLESITGPRDLRGLDDDQLDAARDRGPRPARQSCSRVGGHLGPNLGVVELTMAIHRVFDSPRDRVVFDTGHQAYVHKMLTGRAGEFGGLRQRGRAVGLPQPGRVAPRHRRELPRLDLAELRRRPGQGLPHPRRGPPRRRRHRRRRAHRRHGLGGPQQHRRRPRQPPGDRGQRQRPLLHPDRRRADDRADRAAHQPALRAGARPGQEAPHLGQGRRARPPTTRCTR